MPLADPKNFLFPPLHIELELMKCFVRAMYHQDSGFKYSNEKFDSYKSDAKLIAGIFIGPEIQKLFADENFRNILIQKNWKLGTHLSWLQKTFLETIELKLHRHCGKYDRSIQTSW